MLASHRADIARDIKALIEPAQVKILDKAERRKNYTQLSATIPYEWRMHLNHILYDNLLNYS